MRKLFYNIYRKLIIAVVFLTSANILFATDFYAVSNGNINSAATWANSCGGVGGFGVPGAGDNAYICSGVTVTVNASLAVNNLYLQGGTLNFTTNNRTLNINNDLIVSNSNTITGNAATRVLNITGSLTILSGASLNIAGQTVNVAGDVLVDGTLVISNATGAKTFSSNLILGAGGFLSYTAAETITLSGNLITSAGSSITGTATGILNVGTNMQVLSGGKTTIGRLTLTIGGTTSISDTLELNVNTGIKTFVGKVSVNSGGAWISTTVTTNTNLIFRDGITNNATSFEAGACTFNTNDQNLDGGTAMSFTSAVRIAGAITVTNQISDGITISGSLNGTVAGSTWENDVNSVLYYRNAAAPMATGTLSVSASPNTVYYDLNGAQAVKGVTYDNLIISSGGTKTLNATATVNDDLIINSGVSFNPAGYNFTVSDTTMIYGTFADGTAAGTTNLQYVELNGGTINGGQTGIVNILDDFDIINGDGTIGRVALTVSGITTVGSGRTLTLSNINGAKTFADKVVNDGIWVSTTITTAANLVFQSGIENNGTSFSAGAATFNTNDQDISGSTSLSFSSSVIITGAITITNQISDGITISGSLNGTVAGSTWENDVNSILYYRNTAVPMATGTLTVSASPSTVYYNLAGAQAVKGTVYDNLILSTSGTKTLSSSIVVEGDLSISGTAVLAVGTYDINIAGNWNNSSTAADPFTQGTRTVTFDGTSAQTINNTGDSDGTSFYNLVIDNTFPDEAITLNTEVNVAGDLNLSVGHIVTDAVNILVLGTAATVTIGSNPDDSFVKGPMIHTYNVSGSEVLKIFPIGKGDKMHRADLTIRQTNTTATEYTAEFFYIGADIYSYDLPLTLDKVSEVAHWNISNGGATNINTGSVNLYYIEEDVVEDEPNLRIAKDDGAGAWIDLGGAGTASPTGSISSSVNFTSMSKFTLANAKDGKNPLPIELLTFNASNLDKNVILSWTTTSEINNDFFTIERSLDAQSFEIIANLNGAGNSNSIIDYSFVDYNPYSGVSYYRLKQTDFDGGFTYSDMVAVNVLSENELTFTAYQRESDLYLHVITNIVGKAEVEVYDCAGQLLLSKVEIIEKNESQIEINTDSYKPGVYIIKLNVETYQKVIKVFIK